MALSKAETRDAIASLAKELGEEVPANLAQLDKLDLLTPILEALQQKKADLKGDDEAGGDVDKDGINSNAGVGAPPPPPTLPEPPAAPTKLVAITYEVALGKQVTTKRGDIGALETVWPKDFAGGQKDLDHWVAHGFVIETKHYEQ